MEKAIDKVGSDGGGAPVGTKKKNHISLKQRNRMIFYVAVMALPVIQVCIFYVYMHVNSILLAFRDYDAVSSSFTWIGFENFKDVFSLLFSESFLSTTVLNSVILYLCTLFVGITFALVFSNYIYKKMAGAGLFKVVLFLPQIVSMVVMVILFRYFVERAIPVIINEITGDVIGSLLTTESVNFWIVLGYTLLVGFGTQVLLYTGAMSGISQEMVDAAKVDGFTPLKEFIYITIPSIYNTLVTFIVVGIAAIATNQMNLYSFYGTGAPVNGQTLGYYLFMNIKTADESASPYTEYPYLSAFGVVLTVFVVPLTLIIRKLLEKFGPSNE